MLALTETREQNVAAMQGVGFAYETTACTPPAPFTDIILMQWIERRCNSSECYQDATVEDTMLPPQTTVLSRGSSPICNGTIVVG